MSDQQPPDIEPHDMEPVQPNRPAPGAERPVGQLDAIIANLSSYATPVVKEIAARAAELAAKAGAAAGPIAHRAADKTEAVGGQIADRSREFATDLRREPTVDAATATAPTPPDTLTQPDIL